MMIGSRQVRRPPEQWQDRPGWKTVAPSPGTRADLSRRTSRRRQGTASSAPFSRPTCPSAALWAPKVTATRRPSLRLTTASWRVLRASRRTGDISSRTTWRTTAGRTELRRRISYCSSIDSISCSASIISSPLSSYIRHRPTIFPPIHRKPATSRPQWKPSFTARRIATSTTVNITRSASPPLPLNSAVIWTACNGGVGGNRGQKCSTLKFYCSHILGLHHLCTAKWNG